MPGLLKRPHDRMDGGDENDAGPPEKKRQVSNPGLGETQSPVNGGIGRAENGVMENGYSPDAGLIKAVETATGEPPPELFHITGSYISLSTLVERLAQETFIELEQLILDLASIQSEQVNGYGSAQSVEINIRKKQKLWDFAHGYRAKFIKLLVLSKWSQQSEAVSKVIDVNAWMQQQKELYRNSYAWLGELKRMLSHHKLPAPDLKTSLEILSTGKADWYPDIGFDPPTPYTPKQLLKALRTINTHLTIRLNGHEDIPLQMMDFSISSGRATFRVKDEFELDLSIADEDPASQLYFIDFRFAFSPASAEIPDGPLRDHVEGRTNEILRTKGLTGCYEFLHELVMTHELTLLRHQSYELSRGRWTENIKVEPVHRSLIIQYWINRPGPKSWIEIGIRRVRKSELGSSRNLSHIGVRWHRQGKEVLDHGIEIDGGNLCLEDLLKKIIACHTNHTFNSIKKGLRKDKVYAAGELSVKHRAHPKEPAESSLSIQLTCSSTAKLVQEPISGFFAISPSSNLHYRAERELNRLKDPAREATGRLSFLRCNETFEQVQLRARIRRWQHLQTIQLKSETVKQKFPIKDVMRIMFFRVPNWQGQWALALTSGISGDQWYAVYLKDPNRKISTAEIASGTSQPIKKSLPLSVKNPVSAIFEATYGRLSILEKTAAAVISQWINASELTRLKMTYRFQEAKKCLPKVKAADYFVDYKPDNISSNDKQPWCCDIVKVQYIGHSSAMDLRAQAQTTTVVTAKLRHRIKNIAQLATTMDPTIAFHPTSGNFSFRIRAPLGHPSVVEIPRRFSQISKLVRFISSISAAGLMCSHISLDHLRVLYGPSSSEKTLPPLAASIMFPQDSAMHLKLEQGNPHTRIVGQLNTMLNAETFQNPLQWVLAIMESTLPLLQGFESIEREGVPGVETRILCRGATFYRVTMNGKDSRIALEIRMQRRASDGTVWWMDVPKESWSIDNKPKTAASTTSTGTSTSSNNNKLGAPQQSQSDTKEDEARKTMSYARLKSIRDLWIGFLKEKSPRWQALGLGVMCNPTDAGACIEKVSLALAKAVLKADTITLEDAKKMEQSVKAASGSASGSAGAGAGQGAVKGRQEIITVD